MGINLNSEFELKERLDESSIEFISQLITDWAHKKSDGYFKDFGSTITLKEQVVHNSFIYSIKIFEEERNIKERIRKLKDKDSSLPNAPLDIEKVDIWDHKVEFPEKFKQISFEKEIEETRKIIECVQCQGVGLFGCDSCNGEGKIVCSKCQGQLQVRCKKCGGNGICVVCHGNGMVTCSACHGTGSFLENGELVGCGSCFGKGPKSGSGVRPCPSCKKFMRSSGTGRCKKCDGVGSIKCSKCDATGTVKCTTCDGSGNVICSECDGKKSLISYGGLSISLTPRELREKLPNGFCEKHLQNDWDEIDRYPKSWLIVDFLDSDFSVIDDDLKFVKDHRIKEKLLPTFHKMLNEIEGGKRLRNFGLQIWKYPFIVLNYIFENNLYEIYISGPNYEITSKKDPITETAKEYLEKTDQLSSNSNIEDIINQYKLLRFISSALRISNDQEKLFSNFNNTLAAIIYDVANFSGDNNKIMKEYFSLYVSLKPDINTSEFQAEIKEKFLKVESVKDKLSSAFFSIKRRWEGMDQYSVLKEIEPYIQNLTELKQYVQLCELLKNIHEEDDLSFDLIEGDIIEDLVSRILSSSDKVEGYDFEEINEKIVLLKRKIEERNMQNDEKVGFFAKMKKKISSALEGDLHKKLRDLQINVLKNFLAFCDDEQYEAIFSKLISDSKLLEFFEFSRKKEKRRIMQGRIIDFCS